MNKHEIFTKKIYEEMAEIVEGGLVLEDMFTVLCYLMGLISAFVVELPFTLENKKSLVNTIVSQLNKHISEAEQQNEL